MREHAKSRIEFIRERERRATTDIGSNITTELIPELQVVHHLVSVVNVPLDARELRSCTSLQSLRSSVSTLQIS